MPMIVIIPFAPELMGRMPTWKIEIRRASDYLLQAIINETVLHRTDRQRDVRGRLIATLADYEAVAIALRESMEEVLGASMKAKALYIRLDRKYPQPVIFTTNDAKRLSTESKPTVYSRLVDLLEVGSLVQVSAGAGPNPAKWQLTKKSPFDSILPDLNDLKDQFS